MQRGFGVANTFTVTSSADDGNVSDGSLGTATGNGNDSSGTLRQAINYADATQGPVNINIAAGLSPIVLSGALQPILNSVTINGNGEKIEGNGTRLFFIGVDAADEIAGTNFADRIVVSLGDLTLSGGLAQGGAGSGEAGGGLGAGGAIFINQAADVTLTDVTLVNDKAIGGARGTGSFAGGAGGLGGDGGGYGGGGLYGAGSEGRRRWCVWSRRWLWWRWRWLQRRGRRAKHRWHERNFGTFRTHRIGWRWPERYRWE